MVRSHGHGTGVKQEAGTTADKKKQKVEEEGKEGEKEACVPQSQRQ